MEAKRIQTAISRWQFLIIAAGITGVALIGSETAAQPPIPRLHKLPQLNHAHKHNPSNRHCR